MCKTHTLAQELLSLFTLAKIRRTASAHRSQKTSCLKDFCLKVVITQKVSTEIINCWLDIILSRFFKEVLVVIGPGVLKIINLSVTSGYIADPVKTACVRPLLKKPGLDPSNLNTFWPISKWPFISKILWKNRCWPATSSCRGTTFLLNANLAERGEHSILVLLSVSTVFDTTDHKILFSQLNTHVGVSGKALQWFI